MSWSRWYPAVRRQWNNVQQLESSWFLGGRQAGLTWSPVLQVVFSIRIQENLLLFFSYLNSLLFPHVQQDVALLLDGTAAGRGWDLACVPWILRIALETWQIYVTTLTNTCNHLYKYFLGEGMGSGLCAMDPADCPWDLTNICDNLDKYMYHLYKYLFGEGMGSSLCAMDPAECPWDLTNIYDNFDKYM